MITESADGIISRRAIESNLWIPGNLVKLEEYSVKKTG